MKIVSDKVILETTSSVMVNITSGWFGILLVAPGLFETSSLSEYLRLIVVNLPFGILGFFASAWLSEKSKSF